MSCQLPWGARNSGEKEDLRTQGGSSGIKEIVPDAVSNAGCQSQPGGYRARVQAPQSDITGSLIDQRYDLKQSDSTILSPPDLNRNWVGGDGGGGEGL